MDRTTGPRKRRRGRLWFDVVDVMAGKGPMRAGRVIELLREIGYSDNVDVDTRVYNSLGRWARESKLYKHGRGLYELKMTGEVLREVRVASLAPPPRTRRRAAKKQTPRVGSQRLPSIAGVTENSETGEVAFRVSILPRTGETSVQVLEALLHEIRAGLVRCVEARVTTATMSEEKTP